MFIDFLKNHVRSKLQEDCVGRVRLGVGDFLGFRFFAGVMGPPVGGTAP